MAIVLQNTTLKDRIYIGDTYPIVIEHRLADTGGGPTTSNRGVPADVNSAVIRVWSVSDNDYLELGGAGVDEVPCTITPATATTGALISYTVAPAFTQAAGEYSAFITFTYSGGQVSTVRRRYKVLNKR